tara:strand:- start:647 stop:925 length:279 start_codon:yes stop_codon:yes gene_type:complete
MKAILFTQENTDGFNAIEQKIHNYLLTKVGDNGFKYSASCWSEAASASIHNENLVMPIDESEPRYTYILEALTEEEIDLIENIEIENDSDLV